MIQDLLIFLGSFIAGIVFLLTFYFLIPKKENIDALFISLFALFEGLALLLITCGTIAIYFGVVSDSMISFQQVSNILGGISTLFLLFFSLSISGWMKNPLAVVIPTIVIIAYIFAVCYLPWSLVPIGTIVKATSASLITTTLITRLPLILCVVGIFAYHLVLSLKTKSYRKVRLSLSLLIIGVILFALSTVIMEAIGLFPEFGWLWYILSAFAAIIIYWGFSIPNWLLDRLPES